MPTVEPVVTTEKLRALLAEQTESETLDFKQQCDLNDEGAKVEFAKDVGAMMARGGYLVIGADNHGQPVEWPAGQQALLFDEAILRQKMETYIQAPFTILSATHELDGHTFVVVYVAPHPHGFAVFKKDGSHTRGQDDRRPAFRAGQVYIRRGTSSIPIRQEDVPGLLRRRDEAVREVAREDFARTNAAIERARDAAGIAHGPVEGVTWQLDEATFASVTLELVRQKDYVPLQAAMLAAAGDLATAAAADDRDTVGTILDRIATVAATAITYDTPDPFRYALNALIASYRTGFEHGVTRLGGGLPAVELWLDIIGRVEALGALAVRFERWDAARQLAEQPPHGRVPPYFRSWMRHASVEASRAGLLGRTDERTIGNLIAVARNHINRLPALRPDQSDDSAHDATGATSPQVNDLLLTSLCQFDALWCVVAQAHSEQPNSTSDFFTDFAYYEPARSLPFFDRLVTDPELRRALLPGVTDHRAAATLRHVLHLADTRETWYSFEATPTVQAFLDAADV